LRWFENKIEKSFNVSQVSRLQRKERDAFRQYLGLHDAAACLSKGETENVTPRSVLRLVLRELYPHKNATVPQFAVPLNPGWLLFFRTSNK
jgi:hypothetical protein